MILYNASKNRQILSHHLHIADTFLNRIKRFIGRDEVLFDDAVLITPSSFIHTFWLALPIDVLFIDEENRVIQIIECMPPWKYAKNPAASSVIEFAAGSLCRHECKTGDILTWSND